MLVWHRCHHVFASCSTRQSRPSLFLPRVCTFSVVMTVAWFQYQWHVRPSPQQMAKWRNLPGPRVFHWGLHVVVPRASNFYEGLLFLCFFGLLSCPRVCLFDVSCLLGLTLRSSAPVCCCHQVSWARGRLAFGQEAVRVSSSISPRLVLHLVAGGQ